MPSIYDTQTGRLVEQGYFDDLLQYDEGKGEWKKEWRFTYDALGRRHQVEREIVGGSQTHTTTHEYDAEGRTTRITSPQGVIAYKYDERGRKIETAHHRSDVAPSGSNDFETVTQYTYDALGRLSSVSVIERKDQTLSTLQSPRFFLWEQPRSPKFPQVSLHARRSD